MWQSVGTLVGCQCCSGPPCVWKLRVTCWALLRLVALRSAVGRIPQDGQSWVSRVGVRLLCYRNCVWPLGTTARDQASCSQLLKVTDILRPCKPKRGGGMIKWYKVVAYYCIIIEGSSLTVSKMVMIGEISVEKSTEVSRMSVRAPAQISQGLGMPDPADVCCHGCLQQACSIVDDDHLNLRSIFSLESVKWQKKFHVSLYFTSKSFSIIGKLFKRIDKTNLHIPPHQNSKAYSIMIASIILHYIAGDDLVQSLTNLRAGKPWGGNGNVACGKRCKKRLSGPKLLRCQLDSGTLEWLEYMCTATHVCYTATLC